MLEWLQPSRESCGFLDDVLLRPLALLRVQGFNPHPHSRNLIADPDLEGDCVGQHLEAWCSQVVQGNQQVDERGAFCYYRSVTQLCLTLRPHGLQHARLLCPSLSAEVCSSSCPLSRWCRLILYCVLLLPSVFPSIRVFSSE